MYLIDEGFYIDPFPVDSEHPYIDVDRVAEVDLDTRKITKISFANEDKNGEFDVDLDFFQEYSYCILFANLAP
ncbi:hypothetical protein MASR2M78_21130 [Treponema sp.]